MAISWCSAKPYAYFAETPASDPSTVRAPAPTIWEKLYLRISSRWAFGVAEHGLDRSHVFPARTLAITESGIDCSTKGLGSSHKSAVSPRPITGAQYGFFSFSSATNSS